MQRMGELSNSMKVAAILSRLWKFAMLSSALATASQHFRTHRILIATAHSPLPAAAVSRRNLSSTHATPLTRTQDSSNPPALVLWHVPRDQTIPSDCPVYERARSPPAKARILHGRIFYTICYFICLLRFRPNNQQPRQPSSFSPHTVFHFPAS